MDKKRIYIIGWIVFIVSAVFFILSSLANDDPLAFWGGVSFLLACIIFLLPLILRGR